ncbi:hypothetical protein THI4931_04960 [Pandoraea sputorum]|nr:hypothetical protein THI4931_04960 [Pandoraea sputorum]
MAIEAIATFANVERFMLQLFVDMMGGNRTIAASMFLALDSDAAKTRALNAAAEVAFIETPDVLRIFRAILKIGKTNLLDRNKLVHWTWGDSDDIDDALLLMDPRKALDGALDYDAIFVYKAVDFQRIIEANDKLCGFCRTIQYVINGHVANHDGRMLRRLLDDPLIGENIQDR